MERRDADSAVESSSVPASVSTAVQGFAPSALAAPTRVRWQIVAMLCAIACVMYVDRVNLMVAITSIKAEFGFSEAVRGSILSAFLFGYAVGLVPGGWLVDRIGASRALSIAGFSWGVLTVVTACVRPISSGGLLAGTDALIAFRFLLGICEACAWPAFGRAMAHWMRRGERAIASGLIHSGSGLGGALGSIVVAWIVPQPDLGWRGAFVLSGLVTFGVTLWWFWRATDDPAKHARVSQGELALIALEKEEMSAPPLDAAWLVRLAANRNGYLLCLSEFFFGIGGFIFVTWFYTYFAEVRRAGNEYSGLLSSCNYVALIVAAPIGGLLCDRCVRRFGSRWGRRIVPLVSLALSGLCTVVAPLIENHTASALVFAVSCGFTFAAAPVFWSLLIDVTRRGTGLLGGLMNGAGNLGSALATKYFPCLLPSLGYERSIQLAGLMTIVAGLVWLGLDASRQIDAPAEVPAAPR